MNLQCSEHPVSASDKAQVHSEFMFKLRSVYKLVKQLRDNGRRCGRAKWRIYELAGFQDSENLEGTVHIKEVRIHNNHHCWILKTFFGSTWTGLVLQMNDRDLGRWSVFAVQYPIPNKWSSYPKLRPSIPSLSALGYAASRKGMLKSSRWGTMPSNADS